MLAPPPILAFPGGWPQAGGWLQAGGGALPGPCAPAAVLCFEPRRLADLWLATSDGTFLAVHKAVLAAHCTLFRALLATPPPGPAASMYVAHSWGQLRPLLQHLYEEGPTGPAAGVGGSPWRSTVCSPSVPIQPAPVADVAAALAVARMYGCSTLAQRCQEVLCSDPFELGSARRDALPAGVASSPQHLLKLQGGVSCGATRAVCAPSCPQGCARLVHLGESLGAGPHLRPAPRSGALPTAFHPQPFYYSGGAGAQHRQSGCHRQRAG